MTEVRLPGSKSVTARALFLAAAASGRTVLREPLQAADTRAFLAALTALGYPLAADERHAGRSPAARQARRPAAARCGATTPRPRPGSCPRSALPGTARTPSTPARRCGPGRWRRCSAHCASWARTSPPRTATTCRCKIRADGVKGGDVVLDAGVSSQFLTALCLLGPLTAEGLRIRVTDLVSAPYVDLTLAMMARFGAVARRDADAGRQRHLRLRADRLPGRGHDRRAGRVDRLVLPGRRGAHRQHGDRPRPRPPVRPGRPGLRHAGSWPRWARRCRPPTTRSR